MRIGIDARMYKKGGFGIARYIQKLLEYLEVEDDENEYVVFLLPSQMSLYSPQSSRFRKVCANVPWYGIKEQILMPFLLLRERLDIVHFPHFNVPLLCFNPFVVTIHDLIMLSHPMSATSAVTTRHPLIHKLKLIFLQVVIRSAVTRARHVLTVSRFVQEQLAARFPTSRVKVTVVYEATDSLENVGDAVLPREVMKPYVLYVGSAYPHKNLDILLSVWEEIQKSGRDLRLYLCGQEDIFTERFKEKIRKRNLNGFVVHLGNVNDSALRALYENARCLISPSLEEGFGFTPLEALRVGTPVLVSDIPVFHEILGDAALYFNPLSSDGILQSIQLLCSKRELVEALGEKGAVRVSLYSWKQCVQKTRDLYMST